MGPIALSWKLIKTSRPLLWLTHLNFFLLGALQHPDFKVTAIQLWGLAFFLTVPFCLFIYAINDYYDLDSDRHNPRKGGIFGEVHDANSSRFLPIAALFGLGVSLVGVIMIDKSLILLLLPLAFWLYAYSAPPLRFKGIPILDACVGGGIYLVGLSLLGYQSLAKGDWEVTSWPFLSLTIVLILGLCGQLIGAVVDEKPDRIQGVNTSAIYFGIKPVIGVSMILLTLGSWVSSSWLLTSFLTIECLLVTGMFDDRFLQSKWSKILTGEYGMYILFTAIMICSLYNPAWLRL